MGNKLTVTNKLTDKLFVNEQIDVFEFLFLILITLKLLGLITISWWLVILPLFVKVIAVFTLMFLIVLALIVVTVVDKLYSYFTVIKTKK